MSLETIIRPYGRKDQEIVRHICCETALVGNPIDPVFNDREIFADLIVKYYLQKEPENAFVVESESGVVGYLIGSTHSNSDFGIVKFGLHAVSKILVKAISGKYKNSPQNAEFIKRIFRGGLSPKHPKNAAHLHINILPDFRNQGFGTEMLKRFYAQAQDAGLNCVYEMVFAHPGKTEKYFIEAGFSIFDKRPSDFFGDHLPGPVSTLCVERQLPYELALATLS